MKKLYLLFLLTIIPLLAYADAVEINGIYYNLVSKVKTAEVTSNPNFYSGKVVIPQTVTYGGNEYSVSSIGEKAFYNCSNLTYVTLSNSVISIGYFAFSGCNSIISFTIPNSVTFIDAGAFSNCRGVTSMTLPNSVTSISDYTFYGCSNLATVTIPNSVTKIGENAFEKCSGLTSVNIPNSVTVIDLWAFKGCSSLTSVTIPNSVTWVRSMAFYGCSDLTTISIGNGVTSIGKQSFAECPELTDVYCMADNLPDCYLNAFEGSYIDHAILHVPEGCVDAYKAVEPWSGFKEIVSITETKYNLIYMVDEVEYKTYQLKEGATITPEPAPTKEGFVFSGWSEIPETMPAHDVTIYGTFSSASNYDAVKIGDSGFGTFCSTSDLDFTDVDGLKAYTATGYDDDNGSIWLTRVYHVPAGTGLLMKGTPGTTYQVPHKSTHSYYSNMLVGNTGPTITINETDGDKTNYYLKSGKLLRVVGSATIGQYKSYLQVPTSVFARTRSLDFILDDESGTTYVPHIIQPEQSRDVYYNLQGQRVDKPTKGIYIKNGRKVVIK